MRQMYICCPSDKKLACEAIAREKYKDMKICKGLMMADVMFVVGPPESWSEKMCQDMEWGRTVEMELKYVNEKMVDSKFYEVLISEKKTVQMLRSEKIYDYERER